MEQVKMKAIQSIVHLSIMSFAEGLLSKYSGEINNPEGVINMKRNNCFISELGEEFMFYSAFVRSFDSAFGHVLERMGNEIAKQSFDVYHNIKSFILPDQTTKISTILDNYEAHTVKPSISHYAKNNWIYPRNVASYLRTHDTDNYFYNPKKNEHIIIELKASGDLDNKKAQAEKKALLNEYFMVLNKVKEDKNATVKIYFGTAYNKFGEGQEWKQANVRNFFANEELLIGKDYWNFVCDDLCGFDIVMDQYKKSCCAIRKSLYEIKDMYF